MEILVFKLAQIANIFSGPLLDYSFSEPELEVLELAYFLREFIVRLSLSYLVVSELDRPVDLILCLLEMLHVICKLDPNFWDLHKYLTF